MDASLRVPQSRHNLNTLHAVQEEPGVQNPAAILYGTNDLRYEHHHIPADIPSGHVRVLMRAVGICGSDVHFYQKVFSQHLPTYTGVLRDCSIQLQHHVCDFILRLETRQDLQETGIMQGRIGDFVVEQPMVIGHESAG